MAFLILYLILFGAPWAFCPVLAADGEYRVAIVKDDDSWYFDGLVSDFTTELRDLLTDPGMLRVEDRHNAKGDFALVPELIRQVMADPSIDVVYTAGVVATEVAAALDASERTKPVVGGALQMVDLSFMNLSREGVSTVPNYTFITNPQRVETDLKLIQTLAAPETIHVLIDEAIIEHLSVLDRGMEQFQDELNVRLVAVGAKLTAADTLKALPDSIEAAYISLMTRMPKSERQALYRGLAERGIPTVAMNGRLGVELGALAGMEPDSRSPVARCIALNLHQLLQGVETGDLPVYLPVQDRLVINMATAKVTGWSPSYELSLVGEFLNTDAIYDREPLTLEEAMRTAMKANASVRIAGEEPLIRQQEARITRGNLLPSLDLISRYGRSRTTDIINPLLTPSSARQGSLGLQLRQLLYSDPVISGWRAQKRAVEAAAFELKSRELDAVMDAVVAYLDVLSARALREIEKQNLALTENNLALAKLRSEIGATEPAEVFRWERDRARNRAALIKRDYQVKNAMVVLNQVMATPRDKVWDLEDIWLEEKDIYFLDNRPSDIVTNLSEFQRFGEFLKEFAVLASPELASFDYGLIGQGIILRQKKRRLYVPDVALSASAERFASRSSFQQWAGENQWSVGVELSFPIFTGGARRAEVRKSEAEIRQLSEQRIQVVQQIEAAALAARNNIGQSHPNIALNRQSLDAATQLYKSVLVKYSLGAVGYLNLLDAQQAQLVQQQQSVLAMYEFLADIHRLQRAVAWFEFDKTPREKEAWLQLLRTYLNSRVLAVPAETSLGSGRDVRGAAAEVMRGMKTDLLPRDGE